MLLFSMTFLSALLDPVWFLANLVLVQCQTEFDNVKIEVESCVVLCSNIWPWNSVWLL